MDYRLLAEFRGLFDGNKYLHRDSSRGDWVAHHLYEDLYTLKKSSHYVERVDSREHVLNVQNRRRGVSARRGDGTFGERIPGIEPIVDPGFAVARGPIANVELGIEVKILAKAMIKQIGRVKTDLVSQVTEFNRGAGSPICVAVVGVNYADYVTSYEGDRAYRTDGKGFLHPIQEAREAEGRLRGEVEGKFDELLFLRYKATNEPPYPFEWLDYIELFQDYGAALTRISRTYGTRFG
ncbi:MAG: hypothetical protein H0U89_05710 [Acidimicrobiia bacterium]|nr:hypothetical protein [Acidimicrobiia bacterium]